MGEVAQPVAAPLESGFANPPPEARLRAYWWWLNGNVTKAAITRDLEEMAAKGFGGAAEGDVARGVHCDVHRIAAVDGEHVARLHLCRHREAGDPVDGVRCEYGETA